MAFWQSKTLAQMTATEWESLCDGCGKCCLNKLIDDETEDLYYTNAACLLLDHNSASCQHYSDRFSYVPQCTVITLDNINQLTWLPDSCAYRRLAAGRGLPSWHPLITGSKEAMHLAGMSIQGKVIDERRVKDIEDHIVLWPLKDID
ncbi:YcgN family cysteine cluster protein [Shewanella sp. KJ2020]|uniref:YcgN family cysteine cluster protein n=1 Tax=Shewanella sp. KJ2020 TaxID=2919172 RepID=UPI0020A6FC0F|nr:YcgN family cysteine cluster protein [Shewanella sp. KJ2020]MCP3127395.1 YcgN family cysteine cluster protein [Shewanella sp. KJ2020]